MANVTMEELVMVKERMENDIKVAKANIQVLEVEMNQKLLGSTEYLQERTDRLSRQIQLEINVITRCEAALNKVSIMMSELNVPAVQVEEVAQEESVVTVEETTVIETITSQLAKQGLYTIEADDNMVTVSGHDYDVSITMLDDNKGFYCETWCHHAANEYLRIEEWTNAKTVKTLRGLNGYLRRFLGAEAITI